MKIRFVTKNPYKAIEVQSLLNDVDVEIVQTSHKIHEIQSENIDDIVRDKILKAFGHVGRPVLVEHTGLYIDCLDGFPGGLTQVFWDKLKADKFSELFGRKTQNTVSAKTVIGYCDTKKIHTFTGEVSGVIAQKPRGNRNFQWDCIFIPNGHTETFAEMGDQKNEISMRKKAFDKFKTFLKGRHS